MLASHITLERISMAGGEVQLAIFFVHIIFQARVKLSKSQILKSERRTKRYCCESRDFLLHFVLRLYTCRNGIAMELWLVHKITSQ